MHRERSITAEKKSLHTNFWDCTTSQVMQEYSHWGNCSKCPCKIGRYIVEYDVWMTVTPKLKNLNLFKKGRTRKFTK